MPYNHTKATHKPQGATPSYLSLLAGYCALVAIFVAVLIASAMKQGVASAFRYVGF